ncbi:MAG TPA: SGNH/GDSL hydrolase family protein [Candidatus Dormibacteraeota bacterium]|nr:SGNH/GDSL hydrolase family protein [Candidatus Dormibacteraeota bacterium]
MRVRLLALLSTAFLLLLGAVPAQADGQGGNHQDGGTYLALGDSVAFGYSPLLVNAGLAGNPNVFVGYPEIAAKSLDMKDVNASCPGETTGGFISLTNGADYKCLGYRHFFPLHVGYTTSQLDYAIAYLKAHHDVRLITMDIGANDVFKAGCTTNACIGAVLAGIEANLRIIYGEIRNVAHYHGTLVTVTYYSLSYDAVSAAGTQSLNAPIIAATHAFGGKVASGFDAFKGPALAAGGSSCAAGLLIPLPDGTCDVHPTPLGRDLLAEAVENAVG